MKRFADPAELVGWLVENEIDSESWGTGPYKTVANLWDEYKAGDICFAANSPLRVVRVVQIFVRRGGAILVEKEQVFNNGQSRFRNQPPSEKIKSGESVIEAAYRALEEELGLRREQVVQLIMESESEEKISDSPSYPGLLTRYILLKVSAQVTGLPSEDFWQENDVASAGDPVIRHLWGWQER